MYEEEEEPVYNEDQQALYKILYDALSPNYEIWSEGYYEAANAILESDWLDSAIAKAWHGGQDVVMRELER